MGKNKQMPMGITILLVAFAVFWFINYKPQKNTPPVQNQEEIPPTAALEDQETVNIPLDNTAGEPSLKKNFYFIFDGSGSMRQSCAGKEKIVGALEAVKKFIEKVPQEVHLGLYLFDNLGPRQVVPLGPDNRTVFIDSLDKVIAGNRTPLFQAITYGTDRLVEQYKKQLGYGEYRLIVVTDGEAEKIPEAAYYATKYGIPIYTIGLCIKSDHSLRAFSVSYRAADNYEDLEKALSETVAESESFDITEFKED